MKKYIIIAVVALVILALLGGVGFFGYRMYSELAQFRELGSLKEMSEFSQQNFDLNKEIKQLRKQQAKAEREFVKYRTGFMANAEQRAQRKLKLAEASFLPVSGPYVLIAASTQEQLDYCQDSQKLLELEASLYGTNDPSTVMQQGTICDLNIERTLIPQFKYQMLRLRASMTGSLGHFRSDAEKKFVEAKALLDQYAVPVSREVEAYTRFRDERR